jgi:hypothetical protein
MDDFERARLAKRWPSSRQELIAVLAAFYARFGYALSRKKHLPPGPHAAQLAWFKSSERGVYVNYNGAGLPDVRGAVERFAEDRQGDDRGGSRGFRIGRRNRLLEAPPIP